MNFSTEVKTETFSNYDVGRSSCGPCNRKWKVYWVIHNEQCFVHQKKRKLIVSFGEKIRTK